MNLENFPPKYYLTFDNEHGTFDRTIQDPVIKGKTWRSLDLANQTHANTNSHNPSTSTATSTNTSATSIHHNSLIGNAPIHYTRHDFKNRRSSSEPANEQKLLAHNQTGHAPTIQNTNSNLAIENPSDDFIDCLHQKNIKVSKERTRRQLQNTISLLHYLSEI